MHLVTRTTLNCTSIPGQLAVREFELIIYGLLDARQYDVLS